MLSDMEINALCREIAAATLEEMIEDEYDEFLNSLLAYNTMMEYAAQSYDADAEAL